MKHLLLYVFAIALFGYQTVLAQARLAVAKNPATKLTVYKYPKANATPLVTLDGASLFYIDSTIGNFYSFEMSQVTYGFNAGYVKKSVVQAFETLTANEKKKIMHTVIDNFSALAAAPQKMVSYPGYFDRAKEQTSTRDLYYLTSFYPVLSAFADYYKSSSDKLMLSKTMKLAPYTDGEFAELLGMFFYKVYMQDKKDFAQVLKTISNKKAKSGTKDMLVYGIKTLMPKSLQSQQGIDPEDYDKLVEQEVEKVEKL